MTNAKPLAILPRSKTLSLGGESLEDLYDTLSDFCDSERLEDCSFNATITFYWKSPETVKERQERIDKLQAEISGMQAIIHEMSARLRRLKK